MKYRSTKIVDAIQWLGDNEDAVLRFLHASASYVSSSFGQSDPTIRTGERTMYPYRDVWIVRDASGSLRLCSPDAFEEDYEQI